MSKFLALIRKDWYVNKKSILAPFWIMLGVYVFTGIMVAIALFNIDVPLSEIRDTILAELTATDSQNTIIEILAYLGNLSFMSMPSLICFIIIMSLSASSINRDINNKSEMFYRTQPVSIWSILASKYIMAIFSMIAVFLTIAIFNYIVNGIVISSLFGAGGWGIGFTGLLQGTAGFAIIGIVIGSFSFLCAAIFKEKPLGYGIAIILVASITVFFINSIFSFNIPNPLQYILKFLFNIGRPDLDIVEFGRTLNSEKLIVGGIAARWGLIFNLQSLYRLLTSAVFFVISGFLYKRREF